MRRSQQREAILETIRGMRTHPTADEVYLEVKKRMPNISLGTVYRNLELLASMGEIKRLEVAGKKMRFDGGIMPHPHIICVRCGRVEDYPLDDFPRLSEGFDPETGYTILECAINILGICPQCSEDMYDKAGGKEEKNHGMQEES